MKIDPIIAVKDVPASSQWYQAAFGWRSMHGGSEFDILVDSEGEVMLCLHLWGAHEHPTMTDARTTPGNGLILYLRTPDMEQLRERVAQAGYTVEADIHLNGNSNRREFSLRDPDGYYLTVSDYHDYEG